LRTPKLSHQLILGIKEIPRTGSCEPVESCLYCTPFKQKTARSRRTN